MRDKRWEKVFSEPMLLPILFAAAIFIYALFAYPVICMQKDAQMRKAYREICGMNLANMEEEDEETLQEYRVQGVSILIADEQTELVYCGKSWEGEVQLERYIKRNLEDFAEDAVLQARDFRKTRILTIEAKVTQGEHFYYVYLRREMRGVRQMTEQTAWYFCMVELVLLLFAWQIRKRRGAKADDIWQQAAEGASEKKEDLVKAQKEFVANISHELKTPLTVISSQVEMLQRMGDEIDRDYYFSSIREEIDKMSEMVGNLLDLTIMEHRMEQLEMSDVSLSDLLEYMVLRYDALFQKNQIKLRAQIEKDCHVQGNRMYLEQAVNNYIMNAFQHTAQGNRLELLLEKQDKEICLRVYNEGSHISEEDIEHVWESFYMKKDVQNRQSGRGRNAGLGLYTVKKIVDQHEGECGVENRADGVEFWIRIPAVTEDVKG